MKTLLANKQTLEEKQANDFARYQFIIAMASIDERMVGSLLNKNSKFLGNLNNWQFIHWLKSQFAKLNPSMFHSKFKEGISLDYYPGSDIFEFSYAPYEESIDDHSFSSDDQYDEAVFKSKNAFKIRLVLLFENGKIADIRVPSRVACLVKIKKFQQLN
jgi:hypothetical protein